MIQDCDLTIKVWLLTINLAALILFLMKYIFLSMQVAFYYYCDRYLHYLINFGKFWQVNQFWEVNQWDNFPEGRRFPLRWIPFLVTHELS